MNTHSTPGMGAEVSRTEEPRVCKVAVIWIDWYAYHLARFAGLESAPGLAGRVAGVELVGGVGVHAGLKFRAERAQGMPVTTLQPEAGWQEASKLQLAIDLWKYLSRLQPRVVLVPGYYTLPAIAAAVWARLHGSTSVLMTESTADDHARSWWKEAAKGALIRTLFEWAVTGGTAHLRYLDQLGFPLDRVARFYDVVDNRMLLQGTAHLRAHSSAKEQGIPEGGFLFVGRLAPEKNVHGLLTSWLAYRAEGGTWPLVLAGDGPEGASLRAIAAASKFGGDVYFAGMKNAEELVAFYSFAGCFVLPSTREPWGLVVNEAMAAGLPVIVSTRCGSAEDLVASDWNGFVFDPAHEDELKHVLHRMEQAGVEARRQMGQNSSALIEAYSPENFGLEIERIASARQVAGEVARIAKVRFATGV